MSRSAIKKPCIIIFLAVIIVLASVQPGFAEAVNKYEFYRYETITDLLGITRSDVIQWLSSHENDDYYLGTPYAYRVGDVINDQEVPYTFGASGSEWGLWPVGNAIYPYIYSPNGDVAEGCVPQMNCGGFVHHVLTHAINKNGTENQTTKEQLSLLERMFGSSGMGYAGAYSFYLAMYGAGVRTYNYTTIDSMLDSGILEKGDIIILGGIGYYGYSYDVFGNYSDWHIGFFWGDEPDDNVFWHSTHQTLGKETVTRADGEILTNPAYIDNAIKGKLNDPADETETVLYGNIISEIKPTSDYAWAIVVKFSGSPDDGKEKSSNGIFDDKGNWCELNGFQILDDAWNHPDDPDTRIGWKLINGKWYYFDLSVSQAYYLTLYAQKKVFSAILHGVNAASILHVYSVFHYIV